MAASSFFFFFHIYKFTNLFCSYNVKQCTINHFKCIIWRPNTTCLCKVYAWVRVCRHTILLRLRTSESPLYSICVTLLIWAASIPRPAFFCISFLHTHFTVLHKIGKHSTTEITPTSAFLYPSSESTTGIWLQENKGFKIRGSKFQFTTHCFN